MRKRSPDEDGRVRLKPCASQRGYLDAYAIKAPGVSAHDTRSAYSSARSAVDRRRNGGRSDGGVQRHLGRRGVAPMGPRSESLLPSWRGPPECAALQGLSGAHRASRAPLGRPLVRCSHPVAALRPDRADPRTRPHVLHRAPCRPVSSFLPFPRHHVPAFCSRVHATYLPPVPDSIPSTPPATVNSRLPPRRLPYPSSHTAADPIRSPDGGWVGSAAICPAQTALASGEAVDWRSAVSSTVSSTPFPA